MKYEKVEELFQTYCPKAWEYSTPADQDLCTEAVDWLQTIENRAQMLRIMVNGENHRLFRVIQVLKLGLAEAIFSADHFETKLFADGISAVTTAILYTEVDDG